jgi:hypothetical protein
MKKSRKVSKSAEIVDRVGLRDFPGPFQISEEEDFHSGGFVLLGID